MVLCQDVTAQTLAQQKLEESEASLNELANAMPQLVWIADPLGAIQYYNNRISEFVPPQKNSDSSWSLEGLVHNNDIQKTVEAWAASVTTGLTYEIEHRLQMKDGSYRWFLSRGIPQKDEAGNIKKWFGTATDIHEQKQFADQLEKLVSERTKALQQSNEDLQQFAHVASHDLKEPVRKIKTFLSRLEHESQREFTEKEKLYLGKIHIAANRMFTMIDGVLNYSTLAATTQAPEKVDLNGIFNSIGTDLEVMIEETNTKIIYGNLPTVEGSTVLLYQLFYNLVNNSIKFSKPDLPTVIRVDSITVRQQNGFFAQITFTDNGIGFDNQYANVIFNTFTRLHSKDRFDGTGLGLALCKKIVERHGGTIEADGIEGKGATFTIILPFQQTLSNR